MTRFGSVLVLGWIYPGLCIKLMTEKVVDARSLLLSYIIL